MAPGLAQQTDGDLQPGTGNQTILHRPLDAEIGASRVPHRGDPGPQGRLQVARRLVEAIGEGSLHHPEEVHVADRDVDVGVDEPGKQGLAGAIHHLVPVQPLPHLHDAACGDR